MGLDMYLYLKKGKIATETLPARFYPSELKEFGQDLAKRYVAIKSQVYMVGYWRNANEINEWFFNHCEANNDGNDYYILNDNVDYLYEECKAHPEWKDSDYTRHLLAKLKQVLQKHPEYELVYSASR